VSVEGATREKPPREIIAACVLILCASVVACFFAMSSPDLQPPSIRNFSVIAVLAFLIIWGVLRRQNWLRWLLVALYAVDAAFMIFVIANGGFPRLPPLLRLHAATQIVTGVLLVLPRSSAWFASR